jgi:hypothetical protein
MLSVLIRCFFIDLSSALRLIPSGTHFAFRTWLWFETSIPNVIA